MRSGSPRHMLHPPKSIWAVLILCGINGGVAFASTLIAWYIDPSEDWQIVFGELGSASTLVVFMIELFDNSEMNDIELPSNQEPLFAHWLASALGVLASAVVLQMLRFRDFDWFPPDAASRASSADVKLLMSSVELFATGVIIALSVTTCAALPIGKNPLRLRELALGCRSMTMPTLRDIIFTGVLSIDNLSGGISRRTIIQDTALRVGAVAFLVFLAVVLGVTVGV